jgi:membrane protease YdiL (CAAX protease family)
MVRALFLTALLAWPAGAWAAADPQQPPTPPSALLWSLLIPGGGHFKLGQRGIGLGYLGTELALGIWAYDRRRGLGPDEINMPLLYLQQEHVMGMYTAYRAARLANGQDRLLDDTPGPLLAAAPFRWSVVKSPWVWGSALAGAGINYAGAAARKGRRSYRAIGRMRLQGRDYDRRGAAWAFHGYWTPAAVGAGVSEEMLFRGVLQADWEENFGPRPAVIASSALFGLAHLSDLRNDTISNALFAMGAGYVLGRRTQHNGYRLSETIAAHAWFDIAAGAAIFFADPKNNPIGASVVFAY